MTDADSTQLLDICRGLLTELCSEDGTTAAMEVLHFVSREEDLSRRLMGLDSFRSALEAAAGNAERRAAQSSTTTNCRSALQLLHTRCTLRPVHEFECVTGGSIRIAENRAFAAQSTCKHDGTLKTGGVVWDAAHCLVDLMHRLGPDAFRGQSVLELGAGCGYVGIVAARMGGVVTVTDRVDHIEHLRQNVKLNGLEHSMRVAELEWSEPMAADIPANFDWILASDCVYEEDSHRPLAETLRRFTRPDGATVVLISQETRSDIHSSFFSRGAPLCRCVPPANSFHVRVLSFPCIDQHTTAYSLLRHTGTCRESLPRSQAPSVEHSEDWLASGQPQRRIASANEHQMEGARAGGAGGGGGGEARGESEQWLPFVVAQVDESDLERPSWCHDKQDIRMFCFVSPSLAYSSFQDQEHGAGALLAFRDDCEGDHAARCGAGSCAAGMSLRQLRCYVRRCRHLRTVTMSEKQTCYVAPGARLVAAGRPWHSDRHVDLDVLD